MLTTLYFEAIYKISIMETQLYNIELTKEFLNKKIGKIKRVILKIKEFDKELRIPMTIVLLMVILGKHK